MNNESAFHRFLSRRKNLDDSVVRQTAEVIGSAAGIDRFDETASNLSHVVGDCSLFPSILHDNNNNWTKSLALHVSKSSGESGPSRVLSSLMRKGKTTDTNILRAAAAAAKADAAIVHAQLRMYYRRTLPNPLLFDSDRPNCQDWTAERSKVLLKECMEEASNMIQSALKEDDYWEEGVAASYLNKEVSLRNGNRGDKLKTSDGKGKFDFSDPKSRRKKAAGIRISENSDKGSEDALPFDCKHFWGSEFFMHSEEQPKKNYFLSMLEKSARYAVP